MKQTLYFVMLLLAMSYHPMALAQEEIEISHEDTTETHEVESLPQSELRTILQERERSEDEALVARQEHVRALLAHLLTHSGRPHR